MTVAPLVLVHLRCISLNLEGLSHRWFERRAAALIQHLKPYKPDVLCLQETTFRNSLPNYNQSQHIGNELGLRYSAFGPYGNPIEVMSSDQGGIAIVSRWPFLSVRSRRLPSGHDQPPDSRVALVANIETPGSPFHVVTSHLSWRPEDAQVRLVQMGLILDDFVREHQVDPGHRTLLVGDFNAVEEEPAIQLVSEKMQDTYRIKHPNEPGYTWTKTNPLSSVANAPHRRLDYIFCPRGVEIHKADVIFNEPGTPYLSDHFAVFAELSWKAA
jgi:endonuclease/exonuclease/phosphatase family metal-dependent hydrolase